MRGVSTAATACALLLALTLTACGNAPLQGRYYQKGQWIEFRADGFVVDGFSGDRVRYQVDEQKIVLSDSAGTIEGEIVDPTTVRFGTGPGAMGESFAGEWVANAASGNVLTGISAQEAAGRITGKWRAGDGSPLEFTTEGTYSMGPHVGGSYQMLEGQRVRMTVAQDGQQVGSIDQSYVVEGTMLKLTMPDGSTTNYDRVP